MFFFYYYGILVTLISLVDEITLWFRIINWVSCYTTFKVWLYVVQWHGKLKVASCGLKNTGDGWNQFTELWTFLWLSLPTAPHHWIAAVEYHSLHVRVLFIANSQDSYTLYSLVSSSSDLFASICMTDWPIVNDTVKWKRCVNESHVFYMLEWGT